MTIVMALIGLVGPFLPTLLKIIQSKIDNAQEIKMFGLQVELAKQKHAWQMAKIEATADIAIEEAIHQPLQSYGVRILDAMKGAGLPGWFCAIMVTLYTILDLLTGAVRPVITYAAFGGYIAFKVASFALISSGGMTTANAIIQSWTEFDQNVVVLVLSYWFSLRAARYAFGKR